MILEMVQVRQDRSSLVKLVLREEGVPGTIGFLEKGSRTFHRVRPPKIRVPGTPSSRKLQMEPITVQHLGKTGFVQIRS